MQLLLLLLLEYNDARHHSFAAEEAASMAATTAATGPIAGSLNATPTVAATPEVQLLDEEVDEQLDDDRRNVVEAVHKARSDYHENEIADTIEHVALVGGVVARHEIAETDRRERHEAIVERVDIGPVLFEVVHCRCTAGQRRRSREQYDDHPVDRRLPFFRVVVVLVVETVAAAAAAVDSGGQYRRFLPTSPLESESVNGS